MNLRTILAAALLAAIPIGLPILSASTRAVHPVSPIYASHLAGISGAGQCSQWIQNLDGAQAATVIVDFYKQGGGAPIPVTRPNIRAQSSTEVDTSLEPTLSNGAYAAITSSDREIGVVNRCVWSNTGAALMYNAAPPGTAVIVPMAAKGFEGQTSLLSIQNTDTGTQATATVALYPQGQAQPLVTTNVMIAPGTSTTLDLGKHAAFASVPPGTVGHFMISSSIPLAVLHYVDVETSQMAVFGFEGQPKAVVSDTLYAPLIHAGAPYDPTDPTSPSLDTTMMLVNAGLTDASVAIRYTGSGGTCQGQTFNHPAFTLAAGTSALVANGSGASYPSTGASPLPAGCNAAAVVEAPGGLIAASVVDRLGSGAMAAAYNAFSPAQLGTTVGLPLIHRNTGLDRFNTAIQVMNAGTGPASVTLSFRDANGSPISGCGADCTASIPPGQARLWWPPEIAALTDNFKGSAMITSDQPVAVIVTDIALAGTGDLTSYGGVSVPAAGGGPPRGARRDSPMLRKDGGGAGNPRPTWTPRPTASATLTPAATATPPLVTPTPMPTDTPIPTPMPTSTVVQPTNTPLPTATAVPPTSTPIPTATSAGIAVSDAVRSKVPPAVVSAALAQPDRISGWRQPRDPGKPVSPANPLRECLTLVDPGKPYHPLFNSLVFKAGCP